MLVKKNTFSKIAHLPKITLKQASPITPSMRHYKYITKYLLSKQNRVLKSLIFKIKCASGKSSSTGRTILWGRFSGCKKLYRKISFFNQNTLGIILFSIYDPNRTCFISAFFDFFSYTFSYIPALSNIYSGSIVGHTMNRKTRFILGFRYPINIVPIALNVCLLSIKQNKIAQYVRSAGGFCQVLTKFKTFCKVRLPSNSIITISSSCFITLGILSNKFSRLSSIGKAGRNRLKGSKPTVRGIAMNPVDNPHGGRTNGGCCWVTPWGKPFLFKKTSTSKFKKEFKYKK